MLIGVMSDSHDHLGNIIYALETLKSRAIDTIVHCGDLADPQMISHFHGFNLLYVYGNCDAASGIILKKVLTLSNKSFAGLAYRGSLNGKALAMTHGFDVKQLEDFIASEMYDYVFTGHTHVFSDTRHGKTRVINPGALGASNCAQHSFCILDMATDALEVIAVPSKPR